VTRGPSRRARAALVAALALVASPASAQDGPATLPAQEIPALDGTPVAPPVASAMPDTLAGAAGTWDLSIPGGSRRCTLTLSIDNGISGRMVRFPAGCRRALPILSGVAGWLFTEGVVRLVDKNVRPVLLFTRRPDGHSLGGRSEGGEPYDLVPLQIAAMLPSTPAPDGGEVAGPREIPGSQPVLSAGTLVPTAGRPEAGLYALDRFSEKDVCRITLDAAPLLGADKGASQARLMPGCHDSGITVFDPVAWRFANGHMTLKARRGHAVNLVPTGDGRWRRDPDIGATFVLRRVEPP